MLTELRDPEETEAHVNRVGAYSTEIYEVWAIKRHLPPHEIEKNSEIIRMAAMLHDIGKLVIPQDIREKPGKFTMEEYTQMKQHTIKGAQMLLASAQSEYETVAAEIALNHHEYWNGSGSPDISTRAPENRFQATKTGTEKHTVNAKKKFRSLAALSLSPMYTTHSPADAYFATPCRKMMCCVACVMALEHDMIPRLWTRFFSPQRHSRHRETIS